MTDAAVDQAPGGDTPVETAAPQQDSSVADRAEPGDASADVRPLADVLADVAETCGKINCDCTFKGKELRGAMQYVDNFPYDFAVYEVKDFLPDIFVEDVPRPGLTTKCGQWQPDGFIPNFRVKKVVSPAFADFKVQYVVPPDPSGLPGKRF